MKNLKRLLISLLIGLLMMGAVFAGTGVVTWIPESERTTRTGLSGEIAIVEVNGRKSLYLYDGFTAGGYLLFSSGTVTSGGESSDSFTAAHSITISGTSTTDAYRINDGSGNMNRVLSRFSGGSIVFLGDIDNSGDQVQIRAGGVTQLTIPVGGPISAATYSASNFYVFSTASGDGYTMNDGAGNLHRVISQDLVSHNMYMGDIDNTGNDLILRSGGMNVLSFSKLTSAATFSTDVTANGNIAALSSMMIGTSFKADVLNVSGASPIATFTATNGTSGVRFNVNGGSAAAYRFQYGGATILQLNSTTSSSANKAICWKTTTTLGYCSTIIGADGSCTCN